MTKPVTATSSLRGWPSRRAPGAVPPGVAVKSLQQSHGRISAVELEGGETVQTDHYVLAAGSYSRGLLLPLGLDIPVYPVKGYSLTIPLLDASLAPQSTVLDRPQDCTHTPG